MGPLEVVPSKRKQQQTAGTQSNNLKLLSRPNVRSLSHSRSLSLQKLRHKIGNTALLLSFSRTTAD